MTPISRRLFLAMAAALTAPRWLKAEDRVPSNLDHILLGVSDLDHGIAWVEQRTGVRAQFGGIHPGRGTRNAILALGPRCYLEIIAPDPKQPVGDMSRDLLDLHEPTLFNWAVHTNDIAQAAQRAVHAGFKIDGPSDGSRARPDGKFLRWKACRLKDDRGGLLPFFIEWSQDSVHPATEAPQGCVLKQLVIASPLAPELGSLCRSLDLDIRIERAEKPALRAIIGSPKGEISL